MHNDLVMNNTVDGKNIFNCGFEIQKATHANTVK